MSRTPARPRNTAHQPEPLDSGLPRYVFRLYVAGITPRSVRAISNIKQICEEYLPDRYDLHVIDLYQQPASAAADQIVAVPTLVKVSPLPSQRLIGDLSDKERVLIGLDLKGT
ncbi:MAG: circadian clock KaiB family protein [Anaerolineae bacterium]